MRLKISNVLFIVGIFIICAATPSPTFADTSGKDACLLLTQAKVSDALGMAFGTGSHVTPQFLQTCTWVPTGSAKEIKAVTLNIQPGDTYDSGKRQIELAATAAGGDSKGNTKLIPASGIGDDAYYMTFGPSVTNLMFKKGTLAFKIAIYGALPSDKAMAAEKSLALEVISKL